MPSLADVEREALACTRCRLAEGRTQVVFGVGNPHAGLMVVGEGPGAQEDAEGLPFVGRSGQYLDRVILEEMGLTRADFYIANVVKCRPPGNRDPLADEVAECSPWLEQQLDLVDPSVVRHPGQLRHQAAPAHHRGHHPPAGPGLPVPPGRADPHLPPRGRAPGRGRGRGPDAGRPGAGQAASSSAGSRVIHARTTSVDDTRALAAQVAPLAKPGDLLLLAGDLGAGKTAFVQGFARGLGVTEPVTSPAFVLARPYPGRLTLLHLDVYRLEHIQELHDLGISELLDDGGVTVIEWGDVVAPALPADFLEVRMSPSDDDDDERFLTLRWVGPAWPPRVAALRRAIAAWAVSGEAT